MEAEEQDIYDLATGATTETPAEVPAEAPITEAPAETEEAKAERVRDEKGRFAAAQPQEQTVNTPEVEKPEAEARVPSWRLAEEAERRREAERSLNELKDEFRRMQMQMMQAQQPKAQEAPPELDIFADPQGFVQNLQSNFDKRLQALQLEQSLRFAHYTHGEKFQEAYNSFTDHVTKNRDQASYQRIMAASDPGEALVQWYKEQSLHKELGGSDLQSFMAKRQEEWLKDPAVQAKVIEAFKATQQAQAPSNTLTSLPPSLNRASAARSSHEPGNFSGADMYAFATKK